MKFIKFEKSNKICYCKLVKSRRDNNLIMFNKTRNQLKEAFKKVKILPIISYISLVIFIGIIIETISNLGNVSYIVSIIVLPVISGVVDWFSDTDILKTFREEWSNAPARFHLLVIANTAIYFNVIKEIEKFNLIKENHE